ncbi:MAG: type II toxin-antitoxin system HipA family toxin [Bacteroidetes bacterium]|nr:MAG: type II toxin-antitoxin system HipA family toxin [Bacteroidota bacterium]
MVKSAFVKIWGMRVGAILWDEDKGYASFEYDQQFIPNRLELAPILMPTDVGRHRVFRFPEFKDNSTFKGLPGLLADVLPDKYGNYLLNAWLLRQGRSLESVNPVELLCFIGERSMGALEFEPGQAPFFDQHEELEIASLVDAAGELLRDRKAFVAQLSEEKEKALRNVLRIGTSAGGARAKAVIAYNPETLEIRSGQSQAPEGFEHWIIKFDGVEDKELGGSKGYGRIEMAYAEMAGKAGIQMEACRLLEENGRAHFMTRRFDRVGNDKVHMQTFCALRHFDFNQIGQYSYEQLFETMRMLRLPYPEAEQMFRRVLFNVLAKNCDDHTKNFAFLMTRQGKWSLAPAYDLCFSYRPGSQWVSKHSLSLNGKREGFIREDFLQLAKNINLKKAPEIMAEVEDAVKLWPDFARKFKVDEVQIEAINNLLGFEVK